MKELTNSILSRDALKQVCLSLLVVDSNPFFERIPTLDFALLHSSQNLNNGGRRFILPLPGS